MPLFRWLRTSLKIPSDPPGKDSKGNGVDDCDLIIRSRPEFGGGSVRLPPCVARWTRPPLPTTCVWPSWTWARASTVAIGTVAKDSQCVSSKCTLQLYVGFFIMYACVWTADWGHLRGDCSGGSLDARHKDRCRVEFRSVHGGRWFDPLSSQKDASSKLFSYCKSWRTRDYADALLCVRGGVELGFLSTNDCRSRSC